MNRSVRLAALAIIAAGLVIGCSTAPPPKPPTRAHRGPAEATIAKTGNPFAYGNARNPAVFTCDQTSVSPTPQRPRRGDLVVGPLWIINARQSADPRGTGPNPPHSYKYPIGVRPGATVTMMIAPPGRGHVVIANPYLPFGVMAATYRACSPSYYPGWSVFVQGLAFTDGRTRGCVPLTVQTGRNTPIRPVTISLHAGRCTA